MSGYRIICLIIKRNDIKLSSRGVYGYIWSLIYWNVMGLTVFSISPSEMSSYFETPIHGIQIHLINNGKGLIRYVGKSFSLDLHQRKFTAILGLINSTEGRISRISIKHPMKKCHINLHQHFWPETVKKNRIRKHLGKRKLRREPLEECSQSLISLWINTWYDTIEPKTSGKWPNYQKEAPNTCDTHVWGDI